MLRTSEEYIESLRDGREVWIDGERVGDVATHPAFAPMVNVRARIYDLAREAGTAGPLTYLDEETAERCATTSRPPRSRSDWHAKRAAVDAILDDAGGVVTRVGDETVGEMWSLFDGRDVLSEIDPAFAHFAERAGDSLGDRLVAALGAGLAAGGEVSPVRSCGLLIAESAPWPVTDLRVDWHDDPAGQLARLWRLWQPQAQAYVRRALHPDRA